MDQLKILSYNCTGLGVTTQAYISLLIDNESPSLVLLQETWLCERDLGKVDKLHKSYLTNSVCSIPSGQLITGRGYGGLACLWHRDYAKSVTVIKHPSTRLQAIKLRISNTDYAIINVYLPCDTQQTTVTSAFQEALDDV